MSKLRSTAAGATWEFARHACCAAHLQGCALWKLGQLVEIRHEVWQLVSLLGKALAQEGQLLGEGVVQLEEDEQLIPLDHVQGLVLRRLLQVQPQF